MNQNFSATEQSKNFVNRHSCQNLFENLRRKAQYKEKFRLRSKIYLRRWTKIQHVHESTAKWSESPIEDYRTTPTIIVTVVVEPSLKSSKKMRMAQRACLRSKNILDDCVKRSFPTIQGTHSQHDHHVSSHPRVRS